MNHISELVGKTLSKIVNKNDRLVFVTSDGTRYLMYHDEDCCEYVYIEDIIGNLDDLLGSPLLVAREDHNTPDKAINDSGDESFTWTFYNLATISGYVTIRWYGSSNGYYSESVDFLKLSRMPQWMMQIYKIKGYISQMSASINNHLDGHNICINISKLSKLDHSLQDIVNLFRKQATKDNEDKT